MTETPAPAPLAARRLPPASDVLRWAFGALIVLGLGYWLVGEAIDDPQRFLQVTVIGFSNGMIYALVALGYTLVYGIIELINFAHGDNFMLGTFQAQSIFVDGSFQVPLLFGTIAIPLGTAATVDSSAWHKGYAIAVAIVLGVLFCLAINVTIERIGYRRLRASPRLAALITAIGFSFILQGIGLSWKGPGRVPTPELVPATPVIEVDGVVYYTVKDLMVLAITIPALLALTWLVSSTRPGKAMRATAQDRDASAMMGINVDRTIAFTAAVLGGIGNLTGAVLGGILLGMISAYNDGFGDARWTYTVIFTILIMILVFRPSGLLGERVPEGQ